MTENKLAIDANVFNISPTNSNANLDLVPSSSNSVEVHNNNTVGAIYNRNLQVNNQNTTSTNITFQDCENITLGNFISVGLSRRTPTVNTVAEIPPGVEESIVYKKTPTIKAMMESNQRLNDKYLDIFCAKLGHKFQSLSVHLMIDELDVQQAFEDHKQYGTVEVLFQILSRYFQTYVQFATVGWFTRFLWKNNYKKNVWAIKELWKMLNEINDDTS